MTELVDALRLTVPSADDRAAMAESGALRSALERLRGEYEARGVDFDVAALAAVKAA